MAKSKRILVTGGTGFLGSALVKRLIHEGHRVRVLDNNVRGRLRRLEDVSGEFEFIKGDIRRLDVVQRAARKTDVVFHLAAINGTEFFYSHPDLVLDVGVKGMMNVIDACRKEDVGEIMLASSSEVYQRPPLIPTHENVPLVVPDPLNPRFSYGASKIISEVLLLNFGRSHFERVCIFRPHNVYGPDMGGEHVLPQFILRMSDLVKSKKTGRIQFSIQGSGKETRAFTFVDDFISGLMTILKKGKHLQIYNIGSEEEVSIRKVVQLVAEYFERDVTIVTGKLTPGSTLRRCPNIQKLKKLGFRNQYSLKKGLPVLAKWYVENSDKAFTYLKGMHRSDN